MRNGKKMIYNAGSMFTTAQWTTRKKEGQNLKKMFPSIIIANPVDFETNQNPNPTNEAIFTMDYHDLTDADYVILEIDGWDAGTYMEFGIAIEQAIHNKQKYLLPVISDFRVKREILKGEIPGFALNEMISGAFDYPQLNEGYIPQMIVCGSHQKACQAIQEIENGGTKNFKKRFDIRNLNHKKEIYQIFNPGM